MALTNVTSIKHVQFGIMVLLKHSKVKTKLRITQNERIKFVPGVDARTHTGSEHFKSLKWLPVSKRDDQIILCQVFKN